MAQLLLISGSTRSESTNTATLRTIAALAPDGVAATLYDGLADVPAFNPDDVDRAPLHPAVAELHAALGAADGVILCTPEYMGALPGSFKNLLDWTVGTADLYEKPTAWINVAAEGRGEGAQAELATVLHYVGATVIEPACLRMPVPRNALGEDGLVADEAIRATLALAAEMMTATILAGHSPQP